MNHPQRRMARPARTAAILCLLGATLGVRAQDTLNITTDELTVISATTGAHNQVFKNLSGAWSLDLAAMTASIPAVAAVDALDVQSVTAVYFSLDCDALVAGTTYADEDIILWNGTTFSMAWDGSANGLTSKNDIDALAIISTAPLEFLFSLDEDARLTISGTPTDVADEDLIRYVSPTGFTALSFDGSARGVSPVLNLTGADIRNLTAQWILSFDGPGKIGALSFDDTDLLEFNPTTNAFNPVLWFNGTASGMKAVSELGAVSILVPTATATPSPTPSPSSSPTATATATPSASATPAGSATPTSTATPASTGPTTTPTASATESPTPTVTATATDTSAPTVTPSPTVTPFGSPTPTGTSTPNASHNWELYD